MVVLMLVSSQADFKVAFDRANENLFGVSGAYDKTLADAAANDGWVTTLAPTDLGANICDTLLATLAMIPFMLFWILYPNWGSTLYGEVRGSGDFRKVLRGMLGGIWVTAGLALVFVLLAAKTFGWDFFTATNANFINYFYGYTTTAPTVPIWSYPPLLVSYLIDNSIFQIAMVVLFGVWFLGWSGTLVPVVDPDDLRGRVRPGAPRPRRPGVRATGGARHRPALHHGPGDRRQRDLRLFGSISGRLTLDATLVIAVTFLGSAVAATILPWYKPKIFDNSPVAHLKLVDQRGWADHRDHPRLDDHLWLKDPLYGIGVGNTNSIIFLGVVYGAAAMVYVVARLVSPLAGRRPRRHPLGDPGGVTHGFLADSSEAPRTPGRLSIGHQPPNQPVGPGAVFCQTCLASRYSSRPLGPSSRPMPGLLEAAPLGLRQVGVVVVDPDRPVAQPRGDPLGRPASAVQTAPARP